MLLCSVVLLTLAGNSHGTSDEGLAFTSCSANDFKWTKGSGPPLKSWLKSVVHVFPDSPYDPVILKRIEEQKIWATIDRKSGSVTEIRNHKTGLKWKKFGSGQYDGWLYGKTDSNGEFTGDNITYIYDNFASVIHGKFNKGVLVSGRASKITGFRCLSGFMRIQLSRKLSKAVYDYQDVNGIDFPRAFDLTLMDPLEKYQVYIGQSTIEGMREVDGVYAKKSLPAHSLALIYAGVYVDYQEGNLFPENATIDEREDMSKNWLSYNSTHMIDIPPKYTSIIKYRASLAHKTNHKFPHEGPSLEFCYMKHPRFGDIRCLKTLRNIQKGEEMFEDYNYGDDVSDESESPRWYKNQLKEIQAKNGEIFC